MKHRCVQMTGLILAGSCLAAHAAPPLGTQVYSFHIPREDAAAALHALGAQTKIDMAYQAEDLKGIVTNEISGKLSLDAALRRLTAGTRITYHYTADGAGVWLSVAHKADAPARPDPGPLAPASPDQDQPLILPEVVVTAERRQENLQNVPISAQVVQQATLTEQNLLSLDDLSETLPSVHVGSNSRSANLYIRGTGSGESQTFDQSVGVFDDDIYHGRARMSDTMLFDLDRIEVLKGPQTTFFGNNAIAGAFNIVTAKPTDVPDASASALYGQHSQYAAQGVVNGPLGGDVDARLAVMADGTGGWLHNETLGRDVPADNNVGGRLSFLWRPGSDFSALLKIEGSQNRNIGSLALQDAGCPPAPPFVAAGFCQPALSQGVPTGIGNNFIAQNAGQQILLSTGEYELTLKDRPGGGGTTLTSVTGFYDYHFNENEDTDGLPLNLLNTQAPEAYHQLSQELRLASPTGAGRTLDYLAGVYFHTDRLTYGHATSYFFLTPELSAAPALAPLVPDLPLGQNVDFTQPEQSYSAFEAVTWHLTDSLRWTEGLRASWVNKSYDWSLGYGTAAAPYGDIVPLPAPQAALAQAVANSAGLGVAGSLAGNRHDSALMPSTQLQADLGRSAMAYFSFSQGWKAGGFNGNDTTGVAANLPFAPEHVNAYELGLKSEWWDHQLRLNIDGFRSDYSDLQVATNVAGPSGAILSLVRNAASSRSQGGELEADWEPSEAFELSANVTRDESDYLVYPDVAPTQLQQLLGQPGQDLSGRPTEFAPVWSGSMGARYSAPFGAYRLTTDVQGIASSSFFLTGNDDPTLEQGGYVRLDARLSFGSADDHWAIDLIGKNLTNRNILTFAINWPTAPGSTWVQKEETCNVAVQGRLRW